MRLLIIIFICCLVAVLALCIASRIFSGIKPDHPGTCSPLGEIIERETLVDGSERQIIITPSGKKMILIINQNKTKRIYPDPEGGN